MPKKKDTTSKDLLVRIRERHKIMTDADQTNRQLALEDLRFINVPGEQWTAETRKLRGNRVCYEFNKLRVSCKRIINDMRANRPAGKVRGVDDSQVDTAEVMEGLCRNIWNVSDGDTVIDYATEYQVGGGMGAWRLRTEWERDEFSQSICVEAFKNPFCLYGDPAATDALKTDAQDWIVTEKITKKAFEKRWPSAEAVDFDDVVFDDNDQWNGDDDLVRICEYWWKEPVTETIHLLSDGKVVNDADAKDLDPKSGITIVKSRTQKTDQIKMCIVSGDSILEQPSEWAGKSFPFILLYGEWMVIDGKVYWFGLTRFAKDAQRSYNSARTAIAETIAMAPQAKYWATAAQALGLTEQWAEAHNQLHPFQLYNPDPKAPGPPSRMGGADVPVALMQESQIASEEIKAVTGIYDASLGNKSNEQSGIAIQSRQSQGEIATFNFSDNMSKAIRRTWELMIELIPVVYDTERTIRILGADGAEKYVKVNTFEMDHATGQRKAINDLAAGKFDTTVTVGPSFATQRLEASETFSKMAQAYPPLMQIAGDLIMKSMDLPYAEEIAERMQTMLPPQVQQQMQDGKPVPPEAQAAMAQASQAMQQVQQHQKLVQDAAQEVQQHAQENEKAKAAVQSQLDKLDVKRALFDADVTKQIAAIEIAQARAAMANTKDSASRQVDAANQSAKAATAQGADNADGAQPQDPEPIPEPMSAEAAVQNIQNSASTFVQQAQAAIAAIHASITPPAAPPESIGKQLTVHRENGHIVAQSHEQLSDGTTKQKAARLHRVNGELHGQVMTVHPDGTQSVKHIHLKRGPSGELQGQFQPAQGQ